MPAVPLIVYHAYASSATAALTVPDRLLANASYDSSASATLTLHPALLASTAFRCSLVATLTLHPQVTAEVAYRSLAEAALTLHPRLEAAVTWRSLAAAELARNMAAAAQAAFTTSQQAFLTATMAAAAAVNYTTSAGADLEVVDQGPTVASVAYDGLLTAFGISNPDNAKPYVRERIISDINAALQLIYAQAQFLGYFNRLQRTYTFSAGVNSVTLQSDVQEVEGTLRETTTHRAMRPLASMSQMEQFGEAFLGDAINTSGTPLAAYIQRETANNTAFATIKIFVAPTPTNSFSLEADVLLRAPRYTWNDVNLGTPLYLPHKYVETLLIPLVRQLLTTSHLFILKESLPQIQAQAQAARVQLRLVDPDAGPNKERKQQPQPIPQA